ncbi:hypothetical protein, partial [Treponema endosymbiont of Eucomonympha sp.]|uniref:hypothetical protein n=1 Tax=Treponema endosymbiont of Eucomonympha sp. TaxID=1580831 RepID=UPI001396A712
MSGTLIARYQPSWDWERRMTEVPDLTRHSRAGYIGFQLIGEDFGSYEAIITERESSGGSAGGAVRALLVRCVALGRTGRAG